MRFAPLQLEFAAVIAASFIACGATAGNVDPRVEEGPAVDTVSLYRFILQVSDSDAAAAFYSNLLGTEGRRVGGGRIYFDCGPVILALVNPASDGEKARPIPDYVYFSVRNLEAFHARAVALGCRSQEVVHGKPAGDIVKRPWGERSFYAVDPWGNKLCFVDAQTLFTGK